MGVKETNVVNEVMIGLSPLGSCLLKNVRGMFLTLDGKRKVRAGLQAPGASDLVGATRVLITQEMVGKTVAVFTVLEIKTDTGRASNEQNDFINAVKRIADIVFAGAARNLDDAKKIIKK